MQRDRPALERIHRDLLGQIVAHARDEAPNECCGIIAALDGAAVSVHPATNVAASPLRYEMDGMEQYRIQTAIEDAGHDLGAIYHSHTRTLPIPSQTDISLAFYPDALYVIVGIADEPAPSSPVASRPAGVVARGKHVLSRLAGLIGGARRPRAGGATAAADEADVRAFRIVNGEVTQESLEVVG